MNCTYDDWKTSAPECDDGERVSPEDEELDFFVQQVEEAADALDNAPCPCPRCGCAS